jgi:hypothetical protein
LPSQSKLKRNFSLAFITFFFLLLSSPCTGGAARCNTDRTRQVTHGWGGWVERGGAQRTQAEQQKLHAYAPGAPSQLVSSLQLPATTHTDTAMFLYTDTTACRHATHIAVHVSPMDVSLISTQTQPHTRCCLRMNSSRVFIQHMQYALLLHFLCQHRETPKKRTRYCLRMSSSSFSFSH